MFLDNPDDPAADGIRKLRASLERVLTRGVANTMALQKYDVQLLARTDQLTGLPNRRAWEEELACAARQATSLIVAVVDLDHFKRLQRRALATRPATRCSSRPRRHGARRCARPTPRPLRGRGVRAGSARLQRVARAACARAPGRSDPEGQTISIGVATWDRTESAEKLFSRADAALYAAKQAGRDAIRTAGQA